MAFYLLQSVLSATVEGKEWSDHDIEHMINVILRTTALGVVIYFALLRPLYLRRKPNNSEFHAAQTRNQLETDTTTRNVPRHLDNPNASFTASSSNSARLVDGIMPYSYMASLRRADAKSLAAGSKLLRSLSIASQTTSIANKIGATVVVALQPSDIIGPRARLVIQFLHSLGLVTNLFVILSIDDNLPQEVLHVNDSSITSQEEDNLVNNKSAQCSQEKMSVECYASNLRSKLYEENKMNSIDETIIPRHRVVFSSSVAGRIAFVRQLCPELVIDFDISAKEQLKRFGFNILLYNHANVPYRDVGDFLPGSD